MRKFFLLLLTALFFQLLYAQETKVSVSVNLKDNSATRRVTINNDNVLILDSLDGILKIILPEDLLKAGTVFLEFNKEDTLKFRISTGCDGSDKCIKINSTDIDKGEILLYFQKGMLTAVGKTPITPGKPVAIVKPYVKIIQSPATKPATTSPNPSFELFGRMDTVHEILSIDASNLKVNPFLCCTDSTPTPVKPIKNCNLPDCNPDIIRSLVNKLYETPCLDPDGNAVSAQYAILLDARNGTVPTPLYLQFKKSKEKKGEYLTVLKAEEFRPKAKREVAIIIIREKDTLYSVNSQAVDNFMEGGTDFAAQISGLGKKEEEPKTTKDGGDETAGSGAPEIVKDPIASMLALKQQFDNAKEFEKKFKIIDSMMKLDNKESVRLHLVVAATLNNKNNNALRTDFTNLMKVYSDLIKEKYIGLRNQRDTNDTAIHNSTHNLVQLDSQVDFKIRLIQLYDALRQLNVKFPEIDLNESSYQCFKECIIHQIYETFGITIGADSTLKQKLLIYVKSKLDKKYAWDFMNVINDIQAEYGKAMNKKAKFGFYYSNPTVLVPKADSLIIAVKKVSGNMEVFNRSYAVTGGVKIDFSTGFFVNGIENASFVLGQHNFRYKQTRDTILPAGRDSVMYTGRITDTAGNLIHNSTARINYSIGLLAHIYPRTGRDVNYGGVVGVMLDNNSRILVVAGASLMFKAGKNRIALVFGGAYGQETRLTNVNTQYKYDPKTQPENQTYNSKYELPRFYTGGNDISTYTTSRLSWFAGITYNISAK